MDLKTTTLYPLSEVESRVFYYRFSLLLGKRPGHS
nr:MAG TPA: hypothetical protein [Caudoviricetes sp.]